MHQKKGRTYETVVTIPDLPHGTIFLKRNKNREQTVVPIKMVWRQTAQKGKENT